MSRSGIAEELRVPESWLRLQESRALLPPWGKVSESVYRAKAQTIRGARDSGVSLQRIRLALQVEEVA